MRFWAQGIPKGQPRPRAFARRVGNQIVARVHEAGTAEGWKSCIAVAAREHLPREPLDGPLSLHVALYMPRPKSHYLKNKLRDSAARWHTSKPDADNAAKAVMDCLTMLRLWRDDSQVVWMTVEKRYETDKGPGAWIVVEPVI